MKTAHKAANGFIAPFPGDADFTIVEHGKRGKETTHRATGVFIHGDSMAGIYMNYAGISSAWSTFELPNDPDLLREVAAAIELMADDIETPRR
ncbi:hypothetical protein [uncultured Methylobacterium sp.]|uniref:hypothetical protein n=1 Tax=uncultured Methylobacterium sp. TaxID=157278 RepID=UPI0035CBE81B